MPEVSEIKKNYESGEFYIEITRRNKKTYNVRSVDYQSVVDYRNELLSQAKLKQKGR